MDMKSIEGQIFLGARIPVSLKEKLSKYCLTYGIKMNYFVAEAISEKLQEIAQERWDITVAKERLKDAKFVSQEGFNRYLLKRGIKS